MVERPLHLVGIVVNPHAEIMDFKLLGNTIPVANSKFGLVLPVHSIGSEKLLEQNRVLTTSTYSAVAKTRIWVVFVIVGPRKMVVVLLVSL